MADDPSIQMQRGRLELGVETNLNDTIDPPGGADLSSFRDSFMTSKASAPRVVMSAQELQKLEIKVLGLHAEVIDAEVEELIRLGLIDPSQSKAIREMVRALTTAPVNSRAALLDKVKSTLLSSIGSRVRVVGKRKVQNSALSDAEMHALLESQKRGASSHQLQSYTAPQATETAKQPSPVIGATRVASSVVQESLESLGNAEAKEDREQEAQAQQERIEERQVINELYLETGEVLDGNFRIINRDNKQEYKKLIVKKKEARTDLPEY